MDAKHRQAAVTSVGEFLDYRRRIGWVSNAITDGGEIRCFGCRRDPGTNRVQVNIGHRRAEPGVIQQRLRLEATFPRSDPSTDPRHWLAGLDIRSDSAYTN